MQLGLTCRFFFLTILFTLFIVFEVYITIWPVTSGYIPQKLMSLAIDQILFRFLCFVIPAIAVIVIISIIFSHRIAGPIYNIERKLDGVIQGDDTGFIHLRKGDELKELADKINKLISLVRNAETPANKSDVPSDA